MLHWRGDICNNVKQNRFSAADYRGMRDSTSHYSLRNLGQKFIDFCGIALKRLQLRLQ
jgi:hypothetical protein